MPVRFHIVTPSLNQGAYLAQGLESLAGQQELGQAFSVAHRVLDGGSRDGTPELLAEFAERVHEVPGYAFSWISGPDSGQYAAIHAGFADLAEDRGAQPDDVLAWLNADDLYAPWALAVAAQIFAAHPEVDWLTSVHPMTMDPAGRCIGVDARWGYTARGLRRGAHCGGHDRHFRWHIQQDCTFWRRELWDRAGSLQAALEADFDLDLAADFDLWWRFFELAELYAVAAPLAGYRVHDAQKTARQEAYDAQCLQVLRRRGGKLTSAPRSWLYRHLPGVARGLGWAETAPVFKHEGRGGTWRLTRRRVL